MKSKTCYASLIGCYNLLSTRYASNTSNCVVVNKLLCLIFLIIKNRYEIKDNFDIKFYLAMRDIAIGKTLIAFPPNIYSLTVF